MHRFLVWGTGADAERYGRYMRKMGSEEGEIVGFIDKDIRKQGQQFLGRNIYMPDEIAMLAYDYIDIWSSKYYDEIYREAVKKYHISANKFRDFFAPYKRKLEEKYTGTDDREIRKFLRAMQEKPGIDVFYYESDEKREIWNEVLWDENAQLNYVLFEGKRMYLKRDFPYMEERNGKKYIGNMYAEQDVNSPHRYEDGDVVVEDGDVLVDAGACEGNFTLHNIDKVKKVYLIECDQDWLEALRYTFAPYMDKVVLCEKFLSDTDSQHTISLDTLVDEPADFIKMDIEGEEIRALEGAGRLLSESRGLKCAICSYHRHGDEEKIRDFLSDRGIETTVSGGYMLFVGDDTVIKDPELRHGVVRGRKRCSQKGRDREEMQIEEYEQYLNMMNQWLILTQEGKRLNRFIAGQGWHKIAVYGMSIYGRHAIRDLKKTDCTVVCGIDRKKMSPYEGVEILEPTARLPQMDVVINAVLHRHQAIVRDLQKVISCPVVSLEDVVFGSY